MNLDKLTAARAQLGTALHLFIHDGDPISVQCLACGGGELIEGLAEQNGASTMRSHILATVPDMDVASLKAARNRFWNAFKHLRRSDGQMREDAAILASFDDRHNDAALFTGWWDYLSLNRRAPVAVQVFQVWWYATNPDRLSPAADIKAIDGAFPGIRAKPRAGQKAALRAAVAKWSRKKAILQDPRTEHGPLMPTAFSNPFR